VKLVVCEERKRRNNPVCAGSLDCFAPLAMTRLA
jgi:hypothetical protein